MNIHISASELAILTGHNTYRDKSELYIKYWKKYWKNDYDTIVSKLNKQNKVPKLPETSGQAVVRIAKANNISTRDVKQLFEVSKEKDASKVNKKKDEILKRVVKELPINLKNDFIKSANSLAYTGFGTRNETNAVKIYEDMSGNNVDILTKYFHNDIFIIEEYDNQPDVWSIGGKIDGLVEQDKNNLDTDIVLEIKNRMNGLFNKLRDYEKVQCFAYMFILDKRRVHLAECYKNTKGSTMNIIDIVWDEHFWFDKIINKLSDFVDDFYAFLKDEKRKIEILS